ncbi:MAG: universal stress protein [Pseudomonadota bacterium]
MYQRILCPVDGSATSDCGMAEAIKLAKNQNAKLRFLHVVDTYIPTLDVTLDFNVAYLPEILHNNGKKLLQTAEDAARAEGVTVDSHMVESIGTVSQFVVSEAETWPADLIVMGTHGLRGIKRMVMGSDAETIVRTSPVSVLLVKSTHK